MKSFDSCCKAFRDVEADIAAHFASEMAVEIREKTMLNKLSMFMDLDNWPDSPDLQGVTIEDEKRLREWGAVYSQKLQAFHAKTDELKKRRYEVVCEALRILGKEMGDEFTLLTSGPLDERIANVLSKADLLRKTCLDGIGYVDIVDPNTFFAKGFYSTTKLQKTKLYSDLKLCTEHRSGAQLLTAEEMVRLGFVEGIGNESR